MTTVTKEMAEAALRNIRHKAALSGNGYSNARILENRLTTLEAENAALRSKVDELEEEVRCERECPRPVFKDDHSIETCNKTGNCGCSHSDKFELAALREQIKALKGGMA